MSTDGLWKIGASGDPERPILLECLLLSEAFPERREEHQSTYSLTSHALEMAQCCAYAFDELGEVRRIKSSMCEDCRREASEQTVARIP